VAALIIMFNATKDPNPSVHQTAAEAGRAAGIRMRHLIGSPRMMRHLIGGPLSVAVFFWVLGTIFCLWGRTLKRTLDTEVSASANLSQAEKRELRA
jgi:hypothetical protein